MGLVSGTELSSGGAYVHFDRSVADFENFANLPR
jgi:hypothetical protein